MTLEGEEQATAAAALAGSGAPPVDLPIASPRLAPPGVRESIGGAFDLAFGGSRRIRAISIYCGLLLLALLGPPLLLFLAMVRDVGDFEDTFAAGNPFFYDPSAGPAASMLRLAVFFGLVGAAAVILEGQILATAVLGSVASGRRIAIRDALQLSRDVFWRVIGAAILVGILSRIGESIATRVINPRTESALQTALIVGFVVTTVVTAPFAYSMAGIVIGGVGPVESLKRSVRVARARWRLAILVAATGTVLSIVELFGLAAGLDLVARLFGALGLDIGGDPLHAAVATFILLATVVAVGSLLVTVAALVAAPQVFVFLRMTGYSGGLDRARRDSHGPAQRTRIVTRSMLALIAFVVVVSVAGLANV